MADAVRVDGLRELDRALGRASRDMRKELRNELRVVAEPVRQDAERLAVQRISRVGPPRGRSWSRMRAGYSSRDAVAYIVPYQHGRLSRKNPRLKRPKFGALLLHRAMEPALQKNREKIVARLEFLTDLIIRRNGL